ncbi:hypothetical protein HDU91_006343, partial [Kappamyces sp. JEL0680]
MASLLATLLQFFYVVNPYDVMAREPDLFAESVPVYVLLILLEGLVFWWLCHSRPRHEPVQTQKQKRSWMPDAVFHPHGRVLLSNSIVSISTGMLEEAGHRIIYLGFWDTYLYIYDNYRLLELHKGSLGAWILTGLVLDFAYYCTHRAAHE